jgi:hypothetical protein
MHVDVGPARRQGGRATIYDQPLSGTDLDIEPGGSITLTFEASGMKDQRSHYRYRISFTADDVKRLAEK